MASEEDILKDLAIPETEILNTIDEYSAKVISYCIFKNLFL